MHLNCFDSYIGITRKYVKRHIFIKSSMFLDAHGAVWLNTQDNCRRTLGSSARLGTSSDHKLRICQERRHLGRTCQEKGDTRACGPRVSLFLTRPPLVSPFSWQILRLWSLDVPSRTDDPSVLLQLSFVLSHTAPRASKTHTTLDKNLSFIPYFLIMLKYC